MIGNRVKMVSKMSFLFWLTILLKKPVVLLYSGAGRFRCAPRGRGGDIFCAEVPIGESTTIMAAAVKAAYLPTFTRASLRVIFSPLTGM